MATTRRGLGLSLGIGIDAFHTASWVRRHGGRHRARHGVLETTVPMRPEDPVLMFLLCASGTRSGRRLPW
jgi:hypothetical protein